ncbi:MAG: GIY-YIG nuclease family protein [Pseudomonadota bacterium]|nr:GIY-YIG nuclease family protein [Pseudomonadota bacterium]
MNYGFVYVLGHPCMPGIYKVGFTERSPRARIEELNKSTSVPGDFYLICYAEFEDPRNYEQAIHEILKEFRVTPNREFFKCDLMRITNLVMHEDAWSRCEHEMYPILFEESPMFRQSLKDKGEMTEDGHLICPTNA